MSAAKKTLLIFLHNHAMSNEMSSYYLCEFPFPLKNNDRTYLAFTELWLKNRLMILFEVTKWHGANHIICIKDFLNVGLEIVFDPAFNGHFVGH